MSDVADLIAEYAQEAAARRQPPPWPTRQCTMCCRNRPLEDFVGEGRWAKRVVNKCQRCRALLRERYHARYPRRK